MHKTARASAARISRVRARRACFGGARRRRTRAAVCPPSVRCSRPLRPAESARPAARIRAGPKAPDAGDPSCAAAGPPDRAAQGSPWHDPGVTGFGPEHLPYGVFRRAGESPRVGARLGDGVLDLAELAADGPLDEDPALFDQPS